MEAIRRAYSLLDIKSFDEETRTIRGVASTPTPDRMGDIVEPSGAKFAKSIPLLLFHDSKQPVGSARLTRTANQIAFEAELPHVAEPGKLRDRVQEAWQSVKYQLIKGVSIGFRVMDDGLELLKDGGVRFTKFEILELSLVPVPANAEATITAIKQLDAPYLAASGHPESTSAGVSALRTVKAVPKDRDPMKTKITDQIRAFEATLVAKTTERDEIMDKSAEAGETLDAHQTEQYDTLTAEIKSINAHLVRLREREKEQIAQAQVVEEPKTARSVEAQTISVGKHIGTSEPGLALARLAICKAAAWDSRMRGDGDLSAIDVAKQRFPYDPRIVQHLKGAVAGGTVADTNWAAPLAPLNTIGTDFIEYLRPKTIIDAFGRNGVPALSPKPFNVKVPRNTSSFTGYWVGEGAAKPVSKAQFDTVTMDYTKAAAIAVINRELIRYSIANAEMIVREQLAKSVIARLDTDLVDPAKAVSSHVNPASLTNGVTPKATAGTSAANAITDVEKLVAPFLNNNYDPSSLVLIMPNTLCLALSLMITTNGVRQFPNIGIGGGTFCGLPVIGSQYAGSLASYGNMVLCVSASDIGLADDGVVDVSVSSEASLEMVDSSSQTSVTGTGASLVSMFQTNSVAILAERFINWTKLRSTAVTWMQDVNWGAVGSPRNT